MPKAAEGNSNIKLDFVNGHFGYFYKLGILTNGLGIPLKLVLNLFLKIVNEIIILQFTLYTYTIFCCFYCQYIHKSN